MRLPLLIASVLALSGAGLAHADTKMPKIADVQVKRDSPDQPGIYHIRVTIEHEDTGWDDYVELWELVAPDGQLLGMRPFFEPELEKGQTVSALAGVVIPEDIKTAMVRARTHPDGVESEPFEIRIPH